MAVTQTIKHTTAADRAAGMQKREHPLQEYARRFRRSPAALFGAGLLLLIIVVGVIGPMLWDLDPLKQSLAARNKAPGWESGTGQTHPFGTDQLGRDLFARLMLAIQMSLQVGFFSVAISAIVGILAGSIAGFFRGAVDSVIMRIVDIQMSFPFILIAIIWASIAGTGRWSVILIVALRGWVTFARIIRSRVMAVRELAFVESARAVGATTSRIILRHVLPQTTPSIIIICALELGVAIIFESTLGFLGLGVQPPTPTLGNMLADGREYLQTAWWLVIFPGSLLTLLVIAVNTLGDGLRDVLDPRSARAVRGQH